MCACVATIYLVDHSLKKTFKFAKAKVTLGGVATKCQKLVPSLSDDDLRHYGFFCLPRFAGGIQTREGMWLLDPSRSLASVDELMGQERFEWLQKRRKVKIRLRTGVEKQIYLDVSIPISSLMEKILDQMELKDLDNASLVIKNDETGQELTLDPSLSLREQNVRDDVVCELASSSSLGIHLKMMWQGGQDGGSQFKIIRFDDRCKAKDALRTTLRKFKSCNFESVTTHGLFLPPCDEWPNGTWVRAQKTLADYNLKNRDQLEVRKKFRRLKVIDPAKADKSAPEKSKLILIDDSLCVGELIKLIYTTHKAAGSAEYASVLQNRKHVELLDNEKSIRDHGYTGEATVGITHTTPMFGEARFRVGIELPDPERPNRAPKKYLMYIELPYYEGSIYKKSPRSLKGWQKRWWVLKRDRLIYYKSRSDRVPISRIHIQLIQRIELSDSQIPKQHQGKAFNIRTPGRVFPLAADSKEEAEEWVQHLEKSRLLFAENPQFYARQMRGKKAPGAGGEDGDQGDEDEDALLDEETLLEQDEYEAANSRSRLEALAAEQSANAEKLGGGILDADFDMTGRDELFQRSLGPAFDYIISTLDIENPLGSMTDRSEKDVYERMKSGYLVCLLVRRGFPDVIPISDIEQDPEEGEMHIDYVLNNWKLLVAAADELGCSLLANETGAVLDVEMKDTKWPLLHKVLTWKLVEACINHELSDLTVMEIPLLAEWLLEDEETPDSRKMSQRETLLRWANSLLAKSSTPDLQIFNFGSDLQDGEALLHILHALGACDTEIFDDDGEDLTLRAEKIMQYARDLGISVCSPDDLVEGNETLNMALLGALCRVHLRQNGHVDMMRSGEEEFVSGFLGSSGDLFGDLMGDDMMGGGGDDLDFTSSSSTVSSLFNMLSSSSDFNMDDFDYDPSNPESAAGALLQFLSSSSNGSSLDVDLSDIDVESLLSGKTVPKHRVLWQAARHLALNALSKGDRSGLVELLKDGEEEGILETLSGEDLLVRWAQYKLAEADVSVKGFQRGEFGENCVDTLIAMTNAIFPDVVPPSLLVGESELLENEDGSEGKRLTQMEKAVAILEILDIPPHQLKLKIRPQDLLEESDKVNFLLLASLFQISPPLKRHADRMTRAERDLVSYLANELGGGDDSAGFGGDAATFASSASNLYNLAELINRAMPGSIDLSQMKADAKDPVSMARNVNILTDALQKIGIDTEHISLADLSQGKTIALDQISYLITSSAMLGKLSTRTNAGLVELLESGEDEESIESWKSGEVLGRWVKHSLSSVLTGDALESASRKLDLNTLAMLISSESGSSSMTDEEKAEMILEHFKKLGISTGALSVKDLISSEDTPNRARMFNLLSGALFKADSRLVRNEARLYTPEREMVSSVINSFASSLGIATSNILDSSSSKKFVESSRSVFASFAKLLHAKYPVLLGPIEESKMMSDEAILSHLRTVLSTLNLPLPECITDSALIAGDQVSLESLSMHIALSTLIGGRSLEENPELIELLRDGEEDDVVESLSGDELVMRWVSKILEIPEPESFSTESISEWLSMDKIVKIALKAIEVKGVPEELDISPLVDNDWDPEDMIQTVTLTEVLKACELELSHSITPELLSDPPPRTAMLLAASLLANDTMLEKDEDRLGGGERDVIAKMVFSVLKKDIDEDVKVSAAEWVGLWTDSSSLEGVFELLPEVSQRTLFEIFEASSLEELNAKIHSEDGEKMLILDKIAIPLMVEYLIQNPTSEVAKKGMVELLKADEEESDLPALTSSTLLNRWMSHLLMQNDMSVDDEEGLCDQLDLDTCAAVVRCALPENAGDDIEDIKLRLSDDEEPMVKASALIEAMTQHCGLKGFASIDAEELSFGLEHSVRLFKIMAAAAMHTFPNLEANKKRLSPSQRKLFVTTILSSSEGEGNNEEEAEEKVGTNARIVKLAQDSSLLANHILSAYPYLTDEDLYNTASIVETMNDLGFAVEESVAWRVAEGEVLASHMLVSAVVEAVSSANVLVDEAAPLVELLLPGEEEEILTTLPAEEILNRWTRVLISGSVLVGCGVGEERSITEPSIPQILAIMKGVAKTMESDSPQLLEIVQKLESNPKIDISSLLSSPDPSAAFACLESEVAIEAVSAIAQFCSVLEINLNPLEPTDILHDPARMCKLITPQLFEKCPMTTINPLRLERPLREALAAVINNQLPESIVSKVQLNGTASSFIKTTSNFVLPIMILSSDMSLEKLQGSDAATNLVTFEGVLTEKGIKLPESINLKDVLNGQTIAIDSLLSFLSTLSLDKEKEMIWSEANEVLEDLDIEIDNIDELGDLQALHGVARLVLSDLNDYSSLEQAAEDIIRACSSAGVCSGLTADDLLADASGRVKTALLALKALLPKAVEAQAQAAEEAAIAAAAQWAMEAEAEEEAAILDVFEDNIDREPLDPALYRALILHCRVIIEKLIAQGGTTPSPEEASRLEECLSMIGTEGTNREIVIASRFPFALASMINIAIPDTIDTRVLNLNRNTQSMTENLTLITQTAKAIGCPIGSLTVDDLMKGKSKSAGDLLFALLKLVLLSNIRLQQHPELCQVMIGKSGELIAGSSQDIIIRFINFLLAQARCKKRVSNLAEDFKSGQVHALCVAQIIPEHCNGWTLSDVMEEEGHTAEERAKWAIDALDSFLGLKYSLLRPEDILSSHPRVNLLLWALLIDRVSSVALFEKVMAEATVREEARMALESESKAKEEKAKADAEAKRRREQFDPAKVLAQYAQMVKELEADSREQRAFKVWLAALGIEGVKDIVKDVRSGVLLLRALEKIQRGCVDWKKAKKRPANMYQRVDNCNYAIDICMRLKMKLVSIGGKDIADGSKKHILALVWQMWRFHIVSYLRLELGRAVRDEDIVNWANTTVKESGKEHSIRKFDDKTLKNGLFLIDLLAAVHPEDIEYEMVTEGKTKDQAQLNAKYVISVARKLGYSVFALWEDVVEVKQALVFQFVAAVMTRAEQKKKKEAAEAEAAAAE